MTKLPHYTIVPTKNQMKVNDIKTKTMLLISFKKTDFEPGIKTPEGKKLRVFM